MDFLKKIKKFFRKTILDFKKISFKKKNFFLVEATLLRSSGLLAASREVSTANEAIVDDASTMSKEGVREY